MSNILLIGYTTEGTTDKRFLEAIITKTFEEIAFDCNNQIEVYAPLYINFAKGNNFVESCSLTAQSAFERGVSVLCIHSDADAKTDTETFIFKINPAFEAIQGQQEENICKNLVPIVPVTMSESWMLADKDLFKEEINTNLSNTDLGIQSNPENIADPKEAIENALRISQENQTKRKQKITISDLYQPIGQQLSIEKLDKLPSFKKFFNTVRSAFEKLNYL